MELLNVSPVSLVLVGRLRWDSPLVIIEVVELLGNTTVVARQTIENGRRLIAKAVRAA